MGSHDFAVEAEGKTAQEAFDAAVKEAAYWHGHSGYTGTIAEKDRFIMVKQPFQSSEEAWRYADNPDEWPDDVQDKWGPAGAIHLGENRWLFFGWASC